MATERTGRMMESLPSQYDSSRIMEAIQAAQADELDYQEGLDKDLRNQLNVQTATWGLKYWEYPLGIPVNEADSDDIRRSRIVSAWRGLSSQFSAALIRSICEAFSGGEVDVALFRTMTNAITNGDFSAGTTGWFTNAGTLTAASKTLACTGNGAAADMYTAHATTLVGTKKVYYRAIARVTNAVATSLRLQYFSGGSGGNSIVVVENPVQDKWYTLSAVVGATYASGSNVSIRSIYATAAAENGKVMEAQYVLAIDLTAVYGAGNEPTAAEMDEVMSWIPGAWFNGTLNRDYTIGIRFIGARGIPENLDDLKAAVDKVIHAHIGVEYYFTYLTWDELDAAAKTWDQLDVMGLSWNEFETWKP